MGLMILLTVLDIANGHYVPSDQLMLWDTEKAKEVYFNYQYFSSFSKYQIK